MAIPPPNKDEFISAIQDCLITWLRQDEMQMLLAQPPLQPPDGVKITAISEPLLKPRRGRRSEGNLVTWPRLGLEAKPNPFLAFVVEGLVDLSIGITESMAAEAGVAVDHGVYHLRLPRQSLLIYPANVPNPDGRRPHWESKTEEQPDSTVLWIDVLPEGALLHTCHSRGGAHVHGSTRFVFDSRLPMILDSFVEEIEVSKRSSPASMNSTEIARSALQFFLLRILRSLSHQEPHQIGIKILMRNINDKFDSAKGETLDDTCHSPQPTYSSAVKRACNFIHGRLGQSLTVTTIARHSHVSPGHLNRLFRADLEMSVMEYVYQQRLETAKSLLVNTTLPVNVISRNLGIPNSAYFSRMFREKTGVTPLVYRMKHP